MIFQPEWSPDGSCIVFVSDRSGWWNLHRYELSTRASSAIAPMAAEFGQPQWAFGMSTYAFAGPDRIVCTCSQAGLGKLMSIDLATGTLQTLETPFTQYRLGAGRRRSGRVHCRGAVSCHLRRRARPEFRPAPDPQEGDGHSRRIRTWHRRLSHHRSRPWNFPQKAETPLSACSIRLTIPTMQVQRTKSRLCSSNAMAARPPPRRVRSVSAYTTGPAAALRCST